VADDFVLVSAWAVFTSANEHTKTMATANAIGYLTSFPNIAISYRFLHLYKLGVSANLSTALSRNIVIRFNSMDRFRNHQCLSNMNVFNGSLSESPMFIKYECNA
jgi:hypothetical protein